MNFDTAVVAGGIPLGVVVSVVLSLLKGQFKISSEQARATVATCGLIYAIATGIAQGLSTGDNIPMIVINAISSGIALIFGSEGFYQWITKVESSR